MVEQAITHEENKIRRQFSLWIDAAKNILSKTPNFSVNLKRAHAYYKDEEINFNPDYKIPIGRKDYIHYKGFEEGGTNDRNYFDYLVRLFSDEYNYGEDIAPLLDEYRNVQAIQGFHPEFLTFPLPKKDQAHSSFGGYDDAFAPGKTVLDLGPGQCVGLMQLAEKHPQTTFIGVDRLYQEIKTVYPDQPGLQLTHGNWNELAQIPDNSIDTIISVQSLSAWGFSASPGVIDRDEHNNEDTRIIRTLNRILKVGGTIRMDAPEGFNDFLMNLMGNKAWEYDCSDNLFVARRIA